MVCSWVACGSAVRHVAASGWWLGLPFVLQRAAQGQRGALALGAGAAAVCAGPALVGGGHQGVARFALGDADLHGALLGTGCLVGQQGRA